MKKRIILASASPRRKELLAKIGIECEIMPSAYEENMDLNMDHAQLVKYLAIGKSEDVAKKVNEGIVIGSDTFVVFDGQRLGKPKNKKKAKEMLQKISAQWVKIYSGIAIIDAKTGKKCIFHEVTRVKIARLSSKEISAYIATGEPLDKAGAFAIQEKGAVFIEKISGCHTNVIGLPLRRLYEGLKNMGVNLWNEKR